MVVLGIRDREGQWSLSIVDLGVAQFLLREGERGGRGEKSRAIYLAIPTVHHDISGLGAFLESVMV